MTRKKVILDIRSQDGKITESDVDKILASLNNEKGVIFIPLNCKVTVLHPTAKSLKRKGAKRKIYQCVFPCNPFGLSQGAINSLKSIMSGFENSKPVKYFPFK